MSDYCVVLSVGYGVVLFVLWNLTTVGVELLKPYPPTTFLSFLMLSLIASLSVTLVGAIVNCLFQSIGTGFFGLSSETSIRLGWLLLGFLIALWMVTPTYSNPLTLSEFVKLIYDVGSTTYSFNFLASKTLYMVGNFTLHSLLK